MVLITPRRALLATAAGGGLIALGAGLKVGFAPRRVADERPRDMLVAVFLRFGCDGLTLLAPAEDPHYRAARPGIGVTTAGDRAGPLIGALDGVPFVLHPAAAGLKPLYDAGQLAFVHAAGLPIDTRSHFESQEMMERGIVERNDPVLGGWLARHLMSSGRTLPELGAIAAAADIQASLAGFAGAVAIPDVAEFNVPGGDLNLGVIAALNAGAEVHATAARDTVDMIRRVRARYALLPPAAPPVPYPAGDFAAAMQSLAKLVKMNVGVEVAAVDFGGWDHHYQMNQYFPGHARQLAETLAAFWADLAHVRERVTIVAMTEFGRRLDENTAGGTDHGSASVMLVLGASVAGGRIHGRWPGLAPDQLREGDLRVTTDARAVLQEILVTRRGEPAPEQVFPGLPYAPVGVVG
ncbi:MAG: DUF1501 domain-containing protein [Rhodospirillaceae bacterium]|nr:DUF1501 domain-containing protein [Rhodospirillaceae bacterium]